MGDAVEEIIAEPDEVGYLAATFAFVHHVVRSYGWYLVLGLVGSYYLLRNRWRASAALDETNKTPQEIESWKSKEAERLKSIQRLQLKYEEEAAIKAEKQKLLDEQKKKARLEELEKLTKNSHKLGDGKGAAGNSKSFRPEYNPLMGNDSSNRVCFRRPGGGSGG